MIDHVTIRVPDLAEAERCYRLCFELLQYPGAPTVGGGFVEWLDFSLTGTGAGERATRGLHLGFRAEETAVVDAWWSGMTEAGYASDGEPGFRPQYAAGYYGAFVLDPAGNSIEAVRNADRRQDGVLDHLWIRVRDLEASAAFYEAVAPVVGYGVHPVDGRLHVRGDGATFALVGSGDPTVGVHLAFSAPDADTVAAFHAAGVAAGFASLGEPGERRRYHPGYFGAYLRDPDGNNIEAVFHDRPPLD